MNFLIVLDFEMREKDGAVVQRSLKKSHSAASLDALFPELLVLIKHEQHVLEQNASADGKGATVVLTSHTVGSDSP